MLPVYQQLNKSFKKQLIYRIGINAGFFSEYNNMILAMLYCLDHRIQFKLCSTMANFDEENGWNGFFEPFCDDVSSNILKHHTSVNWKYAIKLILFKHKFNAITNFVPYLTFWKRLLYTQDVFGRSRDNTRLNKQYVIPELGIHGDIQSACSRLVELTWRYNNLVREQVEKLISEMNLPTEYIGFHIRGGDKFIEHELLSIDCYFNKVNTSSDMKNVFVLTDDYSVITHINTKYPNWNCYTLCESSEQGYFHADFIKQDSNYKKSRLIRLFASMDILAHSKQFVGTFSSNPGMYLGMRNPEICTGVDFDNWVIW